MKQRHVSSLERPVRAVSRGAAFAERDGAGTKTGRGEVTLVGGSLVPWMSRMELRCARKESECGSCALIAGRGSRTVGVLALGCFTKAATSHSGLGLQKQKDAGAYLCREAQWAEHGLCGR